MRACVPGHHSTPWRRSASQSKTDWPNPIRQIPCLSTVNEPLPRAASAATPIVASPPPCFPVSLYDLRCIPAVHTRTSVYIVSLAAAFSLGFVEAISPALLVTNFTFVPFNASRLDPEFAPPPPPPHSLINDSFAWISIHNVDLIPSPSS